MIVLVGSQKGGCGKSTLAVNICAELAVNGADVCLVDADRQGTGSRWVGDRSNDTTLPSVHCIQRYDNIQPTLRDLSERYAYVIVDAAGRDSRELRTGMTAANVLLVPFRPSQADLDTLPHLVEIIEQAQDINPMLKPLAVVTMAPTNVMVSELAESKDYLRDFPQLKLTQSVIYDRKVYRDALSHGIGVVEENNAKAKSEIQMLVQEILSHG